MTNWALIEAQANRLLHLNHSDHLLDASDYMTNDYKRWEFGRDEIEALQPSKAAVDIRRAKQWKYARTEKGKITRKKAHKKYLQSEKGKEVHRKANKKYYASEKGKTSRTQYNKSEKGKARDKRHNESRRNKQKGNK